MRPQTVYSNRRLFFYQRGPWSPQPSLENPGTSYALPPSIESGAPTCCLPSFGLQRSEMAAACQSRCVTGVFGGGRVAKRLERIRRHDFGLSLDAGRGEEYCGLRILDCGLAGKAAPAGSGGREIRNEAKCDKPEAGDRRGEEDCGLAISDCGFGDGGGCGPSCGRSKANRAVKPQGAKGGTCEACQGARAARACGRNQADRGRLRTAIGGVRRLYSGAADGIVGVFQIGGGRRIDCPAAGTLLKSYDE